MYKILKWSLWIPLFLAIQTYSQPAIPFGLGAHVSMAQVDNHPFLSDLEVEPYLQIWVLEFGLIRLGYNQWSSTQSLADEEFKRTHSTLGVEVLVNLNPALRNPYLAIAWRDRSVLDDSSFGDTNWQEWSLGVGGNWLVAPGLYLYAQVDYRWSDDLFVNPENEQQIYVDYTLWRFNLGLTVFVY